VVALAFENRGDHPVRISGVEVMAVDTDGFVQRPTGGGTVLTVPANAKDQLTLTFAVPAARIATVRVWGTDLSVAPTPD
jgi:hypothetical protein